MAMQPMTSHRRTMNRADIAVIVTLFAVAALLVIFAQALGLNLL